MLGCLAQLLVELELEDEADKIPAGERVAHLREWWRPLFSTPLPNKSLSLALLSPQTSCNYFENALFEKPQNSIENNVLLSIYS